jgi:DNA-directed RNA polymerase subunit L
MSNCSDFLMLKEDHTLGNLLSVYLKMAPHVMMAAYKSKATPPLQQTPELQSLH